MFFIKLEFGEGIDYYYRISIFNAFFDVFLCEVAFGGY